MVLKKFSKYFFQDDDDESYKIISNTRKEYRGN